ncbi:MAG: DUF4178 domain-containing protein [Myxococcota bacterium]
MSLEIAGRQAQCPNCGGPIEWKLGASAAQVCKWCRFTVVRTDRDMRAIGKVADLVPTAAAMAVGDIGQIGAEGFTVGGRLQLDHGKGPWDEWYVGFSDGRWGWLAKAQGNWYLTFPTQASGLPTWEQMVPGQQGQLPGGGPDPWTVNERGQSSTVSAEGELPFPATAGERGRYVDLSGPGGKFATIDYGDGSEPPKFYVGAQYGADQISWKEGGMGPRPEQMVDVKQLKCPNCGAPCPIMVPEQTERAACQNCNALLDFNQGAFQFLGQLNQPAIQPYIPLGSEADFRGERAMCIGFMERGVVVEGVTYTWREYLFYTPAGYRWLMEENNHFLYLKPVSPADVAVSGRQATYGGKKFKLFNMAAPMVRFVIGEFYWKVEVGEQTEAADYINPPQIVSEERTRGEINWSAGEYVKGEELWTAFGLTGNPPRPYDVAPAQPNPVSLAVPAIATAAMVALLFVVYLIFNTSIPIETLAEQPVAMPEVPEASMVTRGSATTTTTTTTTANISTAGPSVNITTTPSFTLPAKVDTINIAVTSDLGHGWIGIACALIHENTGEMHEFLLEQDKFHSGGPAVSSLGESSSATIGKLAPGSYVLRMDPRWARKTGSSGATTKPAANLRVQTYDNRDSSGCCCIALFILLLPLPLAFIRRRMFEGRRWRNSSLR